jgi:hypothetical protein
MIRMNIVCEKLPIVAAIGGGLFTFAEFLGDRLWRGLRAGNARPYGSIGVNTTRSPTLIPNFSAKPPRISITWSIVVLEG